MEEQPVLIDFIGIPIENHKGSRFRFYEDDRGSLIMPTAAPAGNDAEGIHTLDIFCNASINCHKMPATRDIGVVPLDNINKFVGSPSAHACIIPFPTLLDANTK